MTRTKDSQLRDSAAELSALHEQIGALGAEKASLEATLAEQTKAVEELQALLDATANKTGDVVKLEATVTELEAPPAETTVDSGETRAAESVESLSELAAIEPLASELVAELPVVDQASGELALAPDLVTVEELEPAEATG